MKLTRQDIERLRALLTTCSVGGIDSIIIEDGVARGISPDRTCVIISDNEVPSFGAQRVGLSRLSALKSRLDLLINDNSLVMEAKETAQGEIAQLELLAGRNKVQFRCTATALIKAPRSINDSALYLVKVSRDQLQLLLNAIRVMGAKRVVLAIKPDGTVSAQVSDASNDVFTITLDAPAERLSDERLDSVVHYFDAGVLVSILRAASTDLAEVAFTVGAAGTIEAVIGGHRVIMLPQVGED